MTFLKKVKEKISAKANNTFKTNIDQISSDFTVQEIAKLTGYSKSFTDFTVELDGKFELTWAADLNLTSHVIDSIEVEVPSQNVDLKITIYPKDENEDEIEKNVTLNMKKIDVSVEAARISSSKNALSLGFGPVHLLVGKDMGRVTFGLSQ